MPQENLIRKKIVKSPLPRCEKMTSLFCFVLFCSQAFFDRQHCNTFYSFFVFGGEGHVRHTSANGFYAPMPRSLKYGKKCVRAASP